MKIDAEPEKRKSPELIQSGDEVPPESQSTVTTAPVLSLADDLPSEHPPSSQANLTLLMECDDPEQDQDGSTVSVTVSDNAANVSSGVDADIVSCIDMNQIHEGKIQLTTENSTAESCGEKSNAMDDGDGGIEESPPESPSKAETYVEIEPVFSSPVKETNIAQATEEPTKPAQSSILADYLKTIHPRIKPKQASKSEFVKTVIKPTDPVLRTSKAPTSSTLAPTGSSNIIKIAAPLSSTSSETQKVTATNAQIGSAISQAITSQQSGSLVMLPDGTRYMVKLKDKTAEPKLLPVDMPTDTDITFSVKSGGSLTVPPVSAAQGKEEGEIDLSLVEAGEVLPDDDKELEEGEVAYNAAQNASVLIMDASGNIANIHPLSNLSQVN